MKFCKNLQRVVDISDPEWAPYWTNYKMLKKLIKELPSLVPSDESGMKAAVQRARAASEEGSRPTSPNSVDSTTSSLLSGPGVRQYHGDKTTEATVAAKNAVEGSAQVEAAEERVAVDETEVLDDDEDPDNADETSPNSNEKVDKIGKSPGEVAFFKLLHAEFKKAEHFFENAQQEFVIREERVREGMNIMKRPNSIMVNEKWSLLAKSLYRLYKDLLLLETFAIMTYCSFSKILKKHDKVTGYNTRNAFMANVVNQANFTNYPVVLEMITRCEILYEEVSNHLLKEGKENLYEDERLFINMIHRLNEQVLDTAEGEGVPERKEVRRSAMAPKPGNPMSISTTESHATSSLRLLVADIDAGRSEGQVSEGVTGDDGDDCLDRKRSASRVVPGNDGKRQKLGV